MRIHVHTVRTCTCKLWNQCYTWLMIRLNSTTCTTCINKLPKALQVFSPGGLGLGGARGPAGVGAGVGLGTLGGTTKLEEPEGTGAAFEAGGGGGSTFCKRKEYIPDTFIHNRVLVWKRYISHNTSSSANTHSTNNTPHMCYTFSFFFRSSIHGGSAGFSEGAGTASYTPQDHIKYGFKNKDKSIHMYIIARVQMLVGVGGGGCTHTCRCNCRTTNSIPDVNSIWASFQYHLPK